jgi:hypothetical protein
MKTTLLLISLFSLLAPSLRADDDTPVPPEVQKLVEAMVTALKGNDDTALQACWHSPEMLGKVKAAQATAEASTSPTEVDAAKEQEREIKKQTRNLQVTVARAGLVRALMSKYFGELGQLTLTSVEVSEDEDASPDTPRFDGIEIRLRTADGTNLKLEVDSALRVDGVWKFQGRLEDDFTIELPDVE